MLQEYLDFSGRRAGLHFVPIQCNGSLMAKAFHDLSEQEILALAISQEEDDGRIYGEFAERLRGSFPATAAALEKCRRRSPITGTV